MQSDKKSVKNGKEKKIVSQKDEESEEEEEESEEEEGSEFDPNEAETSSAGESSGEESEEDLLVEKKKESSRKRKRVAKEGSKKTPPQKKTKSAELVVEKGKKKPAKGKGKATNAPSDDSNSKEGTSGKEKPNFEGKVDINLYTEDPTNIIPKTVQISKTLKLSCRMISGAQMFSGKITYPDWPGLVFQKKIKDGKAFEFNTNLTDVPNLIKGLQFILKENPTFFSSLKDC